MPTYEYECGTCGHRFERLQRMSDAPVKRCPECGKSVKRLIGGGIGIIFKGSGFYVTDSRSSSGSSSGRKFDKGEKKEPAVAEKASSAGNGDSTSSGEKSKAEPTGSSGPKK